MNDFFLIKKIKQGDRDALDTLIEKYYPSIHAYVFRIMQGDDRCNDITQEVFVRFIKNLATFQGGSKVNRYLFIIAKNCCRDVFRELKEEDLADYENTLASHVPSPHEAMMQHIKQHQMETCIQTLPLQMQECLYLRYYENYKLKEIAQITGVNINTVKSRLRLAMAQLKQLWEVEEHED